MLYFSKPVFVIIFVEGSEARGHTFYKLWNIWSYFWVYFWQVFWPGFLARLFLKTSLNVLRGSACIWSFRKCLLRTFPNNRLTKEEPTMKRTYGRNLLAESLHSPINSALIAKCFSGALPETFWNLYCCCLSLFYWHACRLVVLSTNDMNSNLHVSGSVTQSPSQ